MNPRLDTLIANIEAVIFGKRQVIEQALTAMLAAGHMLIEDAPGLGKTMLARSLAQSIDASFKRVQFTPDMLPTDVTGVSIFHPGQQRFDFVPGPVFSQVLLADEINRTSPRTQASLLEAMEEKQVTVEGRSMPLPELFFVIATQNPIELDGTFPLPEAQIDRFLMRIELGYPDPDSERAMLVSQMDAHPISALQPVLTAGDILELQAQVRKVRLSDEIQSYIIEIAGRSRASSDVRLGISPRGSLALMRAAQAYSFLQGQRFVSPDAIKAVAVPVLAHRLLLDPHREYSGLSRQEIITSILDDVPVPTMTHGD